VDGVDVRPILIVDDDEVILSSVALVLVEEAYQVISAMNGKEALELTSTRSPRLILLDMKMPVMDGWAFAAAYRQQPGPHAPIVIMTAAHDWESRAAEISADGCLAKPFDIDDLLEVVHRYAPQQ
jgi:two-component system, chemotaxis family, chemotaxis protein CheY